MHLFLIPEFYKGGSLLELTGNDYHYLIRVLRYKKGYEFSGRNKKGTFFDLMLKDVFKDRCILQVKKSILEQIKLPEIILYQGVCKSKKMDQIIRQATEVGVYSIIPVVSDFSVAKLNKDRSSKTDRWSEIIRQAIQQSGSSVNTKMEKPVTIDQIPESSCINGGIGLFFHQEVLDYGTLHSYLSLHPQRISLVVGSEGGLSDREINVLYKNKFKSVYLKTNILRAETAALYAVSAVQTIFLESRNWVLMR